MMRIVAVYTHRLPVFAAAPFSNLHQFMAGSFHYHIAVPAEGDYTLVIAPPPHGQNMRSRSRAINPKQVRIYIRIIHRYICDICVYCYTCSQTHTSENLQNSDHVRNICVDSPISTRERESSYMHVNLQHCVMTPQVENGGHGSAQMTTAADAQLTPMALRGMEKGVLLNSWSV